MGEPEPREGLFASLGTLAGTLLAMGQSRLELLGNELETQKLRGLRMLMLLQATLFCAGMAIVLLVALAALAMWEQRIAVVAAFAALFVLATTLAYRALVRMADDPEPPFAATLAEIQEDLRRLRAANDHARPPE